MARLETIDFDAFFTLLNQTIVFNESLGQGHDVNNSYLVEMIKEWNVSKLFKCIPLALCSAFSAPAISTHRSACLSA